MKTTKQLKTILALMVAGIFCAYNVSAQTALSGNAAASNGCGTTAGTGTSGSQTNTSVGCGAGNGTLVVPLIKAVQELSHKVDSLTNATNSQRIMQNGNNDSGKNIQDIKLSLPNAVTLGDAQPNPNNGSTQIPYYLPDNTIGAKILFTDMLGKVMKEELLRAGYGMLNVDTQDLPSGIYNYSLIVDGKVVDNKKMIRNK